MYVGDPANGDQLLGKVPDVLGDLPRLLVMNKRLVVAGRALVNSTYLVEHIGFIREVADVTVNRECAPAGGQCFLMAALVMMDGANVLVENRLALRSAYRLEYLQGFLIGVERLFMAAVVQVHAAQIIERFRFPAPVADFTVNRQRLTQELICLGVAPQMPAGDTG